MANVFNEEKLAAIMNWTKLAFAPAPGADPMQGGAPGDPMMAMQGGAPGGMPMDPAAMGGMPMDPAAAGMGDPMMVDPAAGGAPPPADPGMQGMADQEAMRTIVREELQNIMGQQQMAAGGAGGGGGGKGGAGKHEDMIRHLEERMENQTKILVAALKKNNIDVSPE